MANHPQSTPRGVFATQRLLIGGTPVEVTGNSTALLLNKGLRVSNFSTGTLTSDSTGRFLMSGGLTLTGKSFTMGQIITGDTTGLVNDIAALPGDWSTGTLTFGDNSTGAWVGVRTTGTTWKYLNVTVDLPT